MKKLLFSGIEIFLVALLVGNVVSGVGNFMQKKRINTLSTQNEKQAEKIVTLVDNVQKLNIEKDNIVDERDDVQEKLKKKVATGFSVLYEQAKDIRNEYDSTFTGVHLDTAKKFVEQWGYEAIAQVIKWQQDAIQKQIQETKLLMQREFELKQAYTEYKSKTEVEIISLKSSAEQHKLTATSLNDKVKEFVAQNNWLSQIVKYTIIGGVVYLVFTFGSFGFLLKKKSKIQEEVKREKRKRIKTNKAIRTFKNIDDVGNDTMNKVLESLGIDIEEEDDD